MKLAEPYLSEFCNLIHAGAAARDIHGVDAPSGPINRAFIQRELDRVEMHSRALLPLLLAHDVRATRILDVGCSTGGTTAALALSKELNAEQVIGIDPNAQSIAAAKIRIKGLGLESKAQVQIIDPDAPLPFSDDSFDLVVAVSVLEFIPTQDKRRTFLSELQRLARPGGYIYLSTPTPFQLRELHAKRWFGNQRRRNDSPWASSGGTILRSLGGCVSVDVKPWLLTQLLKQRGLPVPPKFLITAATHALPLFAWQKFLLRKVPV